MRFGYSFTVWDYGEALKLHRNQKISRRAKFILFYRIVPVLAVVGLVFVGAHEPRVKTLGGWLGLSFVIAWLWIGIMLAFAPRDQVRRGFKRGAPAGHATIGVDEEQVLVEVPGINEAKWFWNGLVGAARNEKLLLLYTNENCFLIFPASGMTAEQWKELNAIVDRKVPEK